MLNRPLCSRRASSCWVRPASFCSVIARSSSLRIRPISLPAARERASISNRKNVIRINSLYTQRRVDSQLAPQSPDRDAISSVKIMVLNCVSPISEHGYKTIPGHEPSENTNIRRLQFPDGIIFGTNDAELSCKDQWLAAQERMKKIVNLLRWRGLAELPRWLNAGQDLAQPVDELRRAVQQSKRLVARRQFDIDFDDGATGKQVGDGRHQLSISISRKISHSLKL